MGDLRASSVLPICPARKRPWPSGEPGIGRPRRPGTRKSGTLAVPGPAITFPRAAHRVATCGIASCGTSPFGPRLTGFTRADRTWLLRRRPGKSRQSTDSVRALPETPARRQAPSAERHGPPRASGSQMPHQPLRTLSLQSQQPPSLALLTPRPLTGPVDSSIVATTSTKPAGLSGTSASSPLDRTLHSRGPLLGPKLPGKWSRRMQSQLERLA